MYNKQLLQVATILLYGAIAIIAENIYFSCVTYTQKPTQSIYVRRHLIKYLTFRTCQYNVHSSFFNFVVRYQAKRRYGQHYRKKKLWLHGRTDDSVPHLYGAHFEGHQRSIKLDSLLLDYASIYI